MFHLPLEAEQHAPEERLVCVGGVRDRFRQPGLRPEVAVADVRAERREATGRKSAVTEGFCMKPEINPAAAELNRIRRSSIPSERRNSQPARRFNAPVRSRPELRIIEAMMLMTALPEKP